ncbi:non-hydrolyzing UDP-N-acetylglucosamine 2-epimerase [Methylomonas methanica]|uniref:UDP-N-acetylglucosamine 2-epimerase n=1 Tax=Methylomonas methanica (strain DSM 25384 / MC09) TaxID=857087 RepID=F9ZW37_METMM|nr:UDP-N-acetylglucosamine 2-epimerase (non-hydrolyzing) [Methylomonas methanica]AEG02008.1 UDP-N-acetylglucosamine 2-epimerase [Methylomonas methanica MC09]
MHITYVLGTRPEIIKLASLIQASAREGLRFTIIHTNQHYAEQMDRVFFRELELPEPKHHLDIRSRSHGAQIGGMLAGIERVLQAEPPAVVVVQGDTNSALAGGLAASKLGIPVAHVEAGLRSHDRSMPEEINRVLIDHLSDYLFCPTANQAEYLATEGIQAGRVHVTGNTIADATLNYAETARLRSGILGTLGLNTGKYALLTCHRPSNTDNPEHFAALMAAVADIANLSGFTLVFPIHPRLGKQQRHAAERHRCITLIDPVGYLDMLALLQNAALILTDSGGIQEEACILRRKCLVLRRNIERPEALVSGGCVLPSSLEASELLAAASALLKRPVNWHNPFGDGLAYRRILDILKPTIDARH